MARIAAQVRVVQPQGYSDTGRHGESDSSIWMSRIFERAEGEGEVWWIDYGGRDVWVGGLFRCVSLRKLGRTQLGCLVDMLLFSCIGF